VVELDEYDEFLFDADEDFSVQRTQNAADYTRAASTAVVECETTPTFDPDPEFTYHAPSTSRASDNSLPDVYCTVIDPPTRSASAHDVHVPVASGVETNV